LKIKKIVLKNLFSFYGKQEIYFDNKTVVLAENGFGKSSLLNSIKLALGQKKIKIDSILNISAKDKECFIEIDFSEFSLRRVWDFSEDIESLTIFFEDNILKDYEAEEFLKEKFPIELVDFIFFDGEVEKDLILLKSKKIKRIFEYSFDLDILSNMIIDTKKVANRLSSKIGNEEIVKFRDLQTKEATLSQKILELEEKEIILNKDIKKINELIRRNELKIRNRSREIESIEVKIDENQVLLNKKIALFQEINLYQLPILLNDNLFNKINTNILQSVEIINQNEFEDKFELFCKSFDALDKKGELLQSFYQIFQTTKGIKLTFTKKELISNLKSLKVSIDQKESLVGQLKDIKDRLLKRDDIRELDLRAIELSKDRYDKELEINQLIDDLEKSKQEYKEIHKQLRLEFIAKRDKYSKIKTIEELYNLSDISKEVYLKKLSNSLKSFNNLLIKRVEPFISTYQHISKIYINDKFRVVLEDDSGLFLDIAMLSSGQKQILSFILINTILEFKKFVDFIFIDTPFGRLSNKSRDFIFNNYYLNFSNLTLLVTSSEYDYLEKQNISFKEYIIEKDRLGSKIEEVKKND